MKRIATVLTLALILGTTALAQPVRDDVVWARDVGSATLTLDGVLDEPAWQQAETVMLQWDANAGLPGSGQKIEGESPLANPLDGNDGTVYFLRDDNVLWLGIKVNDKSIGGGRGLNAGNWFFDGLIMALIDRTARPDDFSDQKRYFGRPAEFIYGWWHPADTLDGGGPVPGIDPRGFGNFGVGFGDPMDAERNSAVWDFVTLVDGVANDDTNGGTNEDDTGYTTEMFIDLGALGYDFTQAGGDKAPFDIALQDSDYRWPLDTENTFTSRVWWQNEWANNYNEGVAYILGSPEVTMDSGEAPDVTEPEFMIPSLGASDDVTLDGSLDEAFWAEAPTQFYMQYQASPATMDMNPGPAPYFQQWWRPDLNGDDMAAVVVDPSLAEIQLLFKGNMLYVGVDVADQAINGIAGEDGRDGLRITLRQRDSLKTNGALFTRQFDVYVDSMGTAQYANDALTLQTEAPGAVTAAAHMKGASTPADPTDVDEGYQLEVAIDLVEALGYPDGRGDGRLWVTFNFFDGDFLETQEASYAMRTWLLGERANGASLYGYLDAGTTVAIDDVAEVPTTLELRGNYPNPFNPATTLRYALPQAADVAVEVFDVLGRKVATLAPGVQAAGLNELTFDAGALASGVYLYRVQTVDVQSGAVRATATGRMLLLK